MIFLKFIFVAFFSCGFALPSIAANQSSNKHHTKHSIHKRITHKGRNKHSRKNIHARLGKKVRIMIPNRQPADADFVSQPPDVSANDANKHTGFVASISGRLVDFVHKTVSTLRYSIYKLGASRFDTSRGVYIVDCSSYVDNVLKNIYPNAYSSLVMWSGTQKPTTHDYYDFFNKLANDKQKNYWNKINDVEDLLPGDILVFRYKNRMGSETGGHMMIVMDKPVTDDNDIYFVRVADSAATGHSEDTRKQRVSGIGIGTILLKVDPKTYQPYAFAWRAGSRFNRNVNVAMARPVDINEPINSLPNYLRFFKGSSLFS